MKGACRGKTLIELMVVITLVSGALGIASVTLTALFRAQGQLRRDGEQQLVAGRLADRWRADAHSAVACQAGQECRFTLADGSSIRYAIDGSRLRREVNRGDKTLHRDSFLVLNAAAAEFSVRDEGERRFAVLSIRPQESDRVSAGPAKAATLEALVNLHEQPAAMEAVP